MAFTFFHNSYFIKQLRNAALLTPVNMIFLSDCCCGNFAVVSVRFGWYLFTIYQKVKTKGITV